MVIWPSELVQAIASRRCVLFFGAGVSMNSLAGDKRSRTPNWVDFLKTASKKISTKSVRTEITALLEARDYLTAAEVIEKKIGAPAFQNELKAAFDIPKFQPAEIHKHIFSLDFRICLTPNVDAIYEVHANQFGTGVLTVKNFYEDDLAEVLRNQSDQRLLIKTHGSVSTPSKVIFTRSTYAQARNQHASFYELVDALIRTHTLMFIGCGLEDPDIRSLLENYRYRHPQGLHHFFVVRDGSVTKSVRPIFEDTLRIRFLDYKNTADHSDLTRSLKALVDQVENARQELADNQKW
jgi:hypothetical protein